MLHSGLTPRAPDPSSSSGKTEAIAVVTDRPLMPPWHTAGATF